MSHDERKDLNYFNKFMAFYDKKKTFAVDEKKTISKMTAKKVTEAILVALGIEKVK